MKALEKGLALSSAGNFLERLKEFSLLDSMKKVILDFNEEGVPH